MRRSVHDQANGLHACITTIIIMYFVVSDKYDDWRQLDQFYFLWLPSSKLFNYLYSCHQLLPSCFQEIKLITILNRFPFPSNLFFLFFSRSVHSNWVISQSHCNIGKIKSLFTPLTWWRVICHCLSALGKFYCTLSGPCVTFWRLH